MEWLVVSHLYLGTGTNACYFEDIDKIQTISDRSILPSDATQMIINTEWGALGISIDRAIFSLNYSFLQIR